MKEVVNNTEQSDKVCNPCGRKIKNLGTLYNFVKGSKVSKTPVKERKTEGQKRTLQTPEKKSPSWKKLSKLQCTSPNVSKTSRKSLFKLERDLELSHLNIDDLPNEGLQVKVLLVNPKGENPTR